LATVRLQLRDRFDILSDCELSSDITSLFPKYFNIHRGVIFAMIVGGWVMVPWIIISNAKTVLNFMSAYAVFLAPIAGIMLVDYWFVKKRKIDVPALYDPEGIYGKCVSNGNSPELAKESN
jgi:NCS1 family nucleobase:cation symporter-1